MGKKIAVIGKMDNSDGTFESLNRVYDKRQICPTITTCGGGNIQPKTIRKVRLGNEIKDRGGVKTNPSAGYERPPLKGLARSIMTDDKNNGYVADVRMEQEKDTAKIDDYLYKAQNGETYGVFKLTARECGRLQGVTDADISKMETVNSRSQLYKQFGNSICVPVLMAIFSQLNIQGVKPWNEMTDDERYEMIEHENKQNQKED